MLDLREKIIEKIVENLELDREMVEKHLETPPNPELGDFAFPVFPLAPIYKKAPPLIAEELVKKFTEDEIIKEIRQVGPYINFFIRDLAYFDIVFEEIQKDDFGSTDLGKGRTSIVEFSSTNIAKPFHIGHLRSTVIGNSIRNILEYQNFEVVSINYLGDYGTQFGMMIEAFKLWGDEEALAEDPIKELLALYVKYNKKCEEDEEYLIKARKAFRKLEEKDPENVELWTLFKDYSLEEFRRVYEMLGIEFDSYHGEAYHSQFIPEVVEELKEKNLLKTDDGAEIVDLSKEDLIPAIILKSDGSSTYITREVATAIHRKEKYDFYENIYVVASEQNLHFQQLRAILKEMGKEYWEDCLHIPFGLVSLKDASLSTRGGNVIFLEDVLKEATQKTLNIINERNPELENKEDTAKKIGIGAVIFQDLFNSRIRDYVFDWDQILNFDGETGPYTQYSYARAASILRRADFNPLEAEVDASLLVEKEEIDLVKHLYEFKNTLIRAAKNYEPSIITRYTVDLAQKFNRFYGNCSILTAEEGVKEARLFLTYSAQKVIQIGLNLIGVDTVEKM